jgi:transposase
MTIIRIGLDTSKSVFQVHGVDEHERPVLRRQLRRGQIEKFFAKLPPTRIGLEACGASHHWARVLRDLGHEVVLIPPQYIKPYVKRGKNDAIDAEAICEAMSRPGMRFVPIKSREEQAALMLLKVRDLLTKQSTMLSNAIRGHAAEFGVTGAKGPQKIKELLERIAGEANVPEPARELLNSLASQLAAIEVRLAALEAKLMAHHKADPRSQLLATIPGVGPVTAVSIALKSLPSRKRGCPMPRSSVPVGILPPGSGSRRANTRRRGGSGSARSAGKATKACAGCWCWVPLPSSSRSSGVAKPTRQAVAIRPGFCNCWRANRKSWRRSHWPTRWPALSGPCW